MIDFGLHSKGVIVLSASKGRRARRGLSIMEVLFAIAVLTIGLLGVASIIPVASNNAANAIQTDRAIEEINNRIARDLADLDTSFTEVIVANNSLDVFNNPPGSFTATNAFNPPPTARYKSVSTFEFGSHLRQYDMQYAPVTAAVPYPPNQPRMPDAFCIDPLFLSATSTIRNDSGVNPNTTRNGYDRTVFPCFDPRYQPIAFAPSNPLDNSINPPGAQLAGAGINWDTPRFTRLAIPFDSNNGILSEANARSSILRSDDFSIVSPTDSTQSPGLFVQRGGIRSAANRFRSLTKNTVSSRYSSVVIMSRTAQGSSLFDAAVVTMRDRHLVTVPGGGPQLEHNLTPFNAYDPLDLTQPPPRDNQLLFEGEQIGYVTYSDRPFVGGGGGEFEFRTSRFAVPKIRNGTWLMLMRREAIFVPNPSGGPGVVVPGPLKFAWFRVTDVVREPTLVSARGVDALEMQVAVRGPDWVFHPIQQSQPTATPPLYAPPYFQNPVQANWGAGAAPTFDFDAMPLGGVPPFVHQNYGTTVMIAPDVISVKRFQVDL